MEGGDNIDSGNYGHRKTVLCDSVSSEIGISLLLLKGSSLIESWVLL